MLKIHLHLFARLREQVPLESPTLQLDAPISAGELWQRLGAPHTDPELRVLCAINQTHCPLDTLLADGDEVAFFPPVTGG